MGRTKYNAKTCQYNGSIYHSRLERDYAVKLDTCRKARGRDRVMNWERQVKVALDVNGKHIANYYIDFVVDYQDGRTEWVEVKGFRTPEWQLKAKLFKALYPDRIYRIVER